MRRALPETKSRFLNPDKCDGKTLNENLKHDLKMAIIDNAFGLLPEIKAEKLLNLLKEVALDQTIFIEKRLKQSNPLQKETEKWQINLVRF